MAGYPLLLDLTGRRVVVVGGGTVAARRLAGLRAAGARVRIVAPVLDPALGALVPALGALVPALDPGLAGTELLARPYATGDLTGAWLAVAATNDAGVNAQVAADAAAAGVWCVRADDAAGGTARTPAVATAAGVSVAVSCAPPDPRRSVAIRDAIRLLLDTGGLPLRHHRPAGGQVALVGGGPGDPGLLTVRGRQLLAQADVVLVDKLAPRAWLDALDPATEIIDAGKAPHAHNMTQQEINADLVAQARAGRRVVRLKGGDPYVFGRGGEELIACTAAGVEVEVVPGVTSATAVPAAAGIPVTHRGVTQEFTVVSAHLDPGADGTTVDYDALARSRGTLVFLMGVGRLARIADELVSRGRPASTPVAVIESGTTEAERVTIGTLADIAERAADAQPPAVIVVGDVVALRP
ncbi:MAG TPA: uroporphyrinogen-III C-methyltransferase [Mycobacteriales bacterium]|nr:uroporphyrinogen-III C-methyltransferase [Mycobacteriales bacterium]